MSNGYSQKIIRTWGELDKRTIVSNLDVQTLPKIKDLVGGEPVVIMGGIDLEVNNPNNTNGETNYVNHIYITADSVGYACTSESFASSLEVAKDNLLDLELDNEPLRIRVVEKQSKNNPNKMLLAKLELE